MALSFKDLKEVIGVQDYLVNILIRLTVLERILEEKGILDSKEYAVKFKEVGEDVMKQIQKVVAAQAEAARKTNPVTAPPATVEELVGETLIGEQGEKTENKNT